MADNARRDQGSMYCHACHHQWQRDGESIECPACMSASTEIIDPENDPRHFHNRQPEQAPDSSTEPAAAATPGVPASTATGAQDATAASATPSQPSNNNTGNPAGAANSGNGDAPRAASGHPPRVTFHFTAPQVTFFTFVTANGAPPATQSPPPPVTFYTMHFFPTTPPPPPPTVNTSPTDPHPTNTTTTTQPTQPSQDQNNQNQQPPPIGPFPATAGPQPNAAGIPPIPGLPINLLASLFTSLFNPASAIHGDAVYTQEAFDRIITQLREQVQPGGAPPASQAALDRLRVKEVDDAMLGCENGEGKAKCVVCVDDMVKGEKVAVLPCEHFFHGECVVPWLKLHGTCPVCRRSVEVEEEKGVEGKGGGDVGAAEQGHRAGFQDGRNEGLGDAMDCS